MDAAYRALILMFRNVALDNRVFYSKFVIEKKEDALRSWCRASFRRYIGIAIVADAIVDSLEKEERVGYWTFLRRILSNEDKVILRDDNAEHKDPGITEFDSLKLELIRKISDKYTNKFAITDDLIKELIEIDNI